MFGADGGEVDTEHENPSAMFPVRRHPAPMQEIPASVGGPAVAESGWLLCRSRYVVRSAVPDEGSSAFVLHSGA